MVKVLDLFCGAGGLASGFKKNGFDVTGIDISDFAERTFTINNTGRFIKYDLSKDAVSGKYNIVVGGPPCKPWAAVNVKRRSHHHSDYRLISSFFSNVINISPEIFLFENVPLVSTQPILKDNLKVLEEKGYSISAKIIKYSDFGAPSSRRRLFVFGSRISEAGEFFEKLESLQCKPSTVRKAIGYLRHEEKGSFPDHVWPELKTIHKYKEYYDSGKYGWYVLKWNMPAPSFGNITKTYILHPDSFGGNGFKDRVISIREALNIMGFDSGFQFPENIAINARYQLVVDSVSPVFSNLAARVVGEILKT